ncbi:DUF3224 domain-containing protein [Niveispirillum sp. BGYR6]|uniref:DUF3224 domain-containing protein n=1 Tax=Niveispirillum sp. BGYR6 TaxID=2971249 RepID=UPI0022B99D4C|nr:DUF3224 domain-containing protein [Niveispirillum sp. BGYR6]MDG5496792.1 DUF3224 domain-containing protein [Niveispirillum sp. BGYR6]
MSLHATGTFDVKMTPESEPDAADGTSLGQMLLNKRFHGPLDATGQGRMLTAHTGVEGSAVYVALERVSGTLNGRTGSFVLRHLGTMDRGHPHLSISVVPDSGSGGLAGISGEMAIKVADGNHYYDFTYDLPGE